MADFACATPAKMELPHLLHRPGRAENGTTWLTSGPYFGCSAKAYTSPTRSFRIEAWVYSVMIFAGLTP